MRLCLSGNNRFRPSTRGPAPGDMRDQMTKAVMAWLLRTPSSHTKKAYRQDLDQFLTHAGIAADAWEQLAQVHPEHVAAWREQLAACGMTNAAIRRKLTALRSLFSYLKTYGNDWCRFCFQQKQNRHQLSVILRGFSVMNLRLRWSLI